METFNMQNEKFSLSPWQPLRRFFPSENHGGSELTSFMRNSSQKEKISELLVIVEEREGLILILLDTN